MTVIVDPGDYETVLAEMKASDGETTLQTRFRLAQKVFRLTSRYDEAIAGNLAGVRLDNEGVGSG